MNSRQPPMKLSTSLDPHIPTNVCSITVRGGNPHGHLGSINREPPSFPGGRKHELRYRHGPLRWYNGRWDKPSTIGTITSIRGPIQ